MRVLKIGFFVCLAIWIGGGLLTMEYANPAKRLEMLAYGASDRDVTMMNIRSVCINLFGLLTIVSGLLLAGAWFYKRSTREALSKAEPAPIPEVIPVSLQHRSESPNPPHPIDSKTVSCNFTGWARDGNRIVQEYTYRGQGLDHRITVELTVEYRKLTGVDLPGVIHRFVHFWLFPANGYEGTAEIRIADEESEETAGWLSSRMETATGNATLMNIESREGADAVWRLFSAGRDLEFAVRLNREVLLSLPMPNNPGVQDLYDAILEIVRI